MATHWPRLFYREREHARSKERMADRELNDSVLCDISWELGTQWTYLAVILGFRSSEIEAIETDSLGDSARSSLHMLVTWKNRQPPSVDMSRNLGDALLKIGRADIACRLNLLQRPAVNSTLEEISKHHPQCFVCMERFKKPMELECLHSFCERCLAGLSKDKGCTQIPCPLCRHTTPFSGFESLKPNFQLRSLVEEIEKGLSAYDDSSEATEPQVTVTSQKSNDSREEVRRGENTTDAKHRKEMGKLLDQQETKSVSGGEVGPTVQDMDAKDIVRKGHLNLLFSILY